MSQYASPRRLPIYWWTLSFQAGALNAGGVMSCGRGVSHVTGFGTTFGTEGALGHWQTAIGLLSVPIFFLMGAIISTVVLEHPRSYARDRYYGYSLVLGAIALLCVAVSLLGWGQYFGAFNAPLILSQHYVLLILLSFACGLQNALFSERAGTMIRSTHMTGPITDLGIEAGRLILVLAGRGQKLPHIKLRREFHFLFVRLGALTMFVVGALFGALFFVRYQYLGFLLPSFTCLVLFYDSLKIQRRLFFS